MADLKDRLKELVDRKDDLKAQKAKLEAKLELAEKELESLKGELENLFETSDTKDLARIKQELIDEAESLLAESEQDDDW